MSSGIDENDAKLLVLEQNVERISDVDIDLDRVEGAILNVKVKKHLINGKIFPWGLDLLSLTPRRLLQMCAEIYRVLFWMGMILFYNIVMSRMRDKYKRQLRRITHFMRSFIRVEILLDDPISLEFLIKVDKMSDYERSI
ncbi:multiple RNA-binding domain-containing protein [Spatholobus suberectus]|nr:multiple RNA-binding domain-containing protein [Spatholobus suberectus]